MKPPAGRPGFFSDLRTRQAFWAAVDRQQAFRTVSFSQGKVAAAADQQQHLLRRRHRAQPAHLRRQPGQDPARPGRLEGRGRRRPGGPGVPNVPDGTKFEVDWHGFAGDQTTLRRADPLPARGRRHHPAGEDRGQRHVLGATCSAHRDFDTGVVSYCHGDDPEIGFRRQVDSAQISTTAFSNGAGYSNPEVDTPARPGPPASPTRPSARRSTASCRSSSSRDLPYIWLTESAGLRAFNANCTGFNHENTGLFAEAASCKK